MLVTFGLGQSTWADPSADGSQVHAWLRSETRMPWVGRHGFRQPPCRTQEPRFTRSDSGSRTRLRVLG